MKRHRIITFDFDNRATFLEDPGEQWQDEAKRQHEARRSHIITRLQHQYGNEDFETKLQNFIDLKIKPFSITAFHNKFLTQVRTAFISGAYYPALTAACALGERILNHLMITLREYHKDSPEYKKFYRKKSFDFWPPVIDTLELWNEILPETAKLFHDLNSKINRAIHFNPETDQNDRRLSLEAIHTLQNIIDVQFTAFGVRPWYFHIPGEIYIKKEWEEAPLIEYLFIPNSILVGPMHAIRSVAPQFIVEDLPNYDDVQISDEKFIELRLSMRSKSQ